MQDNSHDNRHNGVVPSGQVLPVANGKVSSSLPVKPGTKPDPIGLLKAFRRRWPAVLGLAFLAAAVAAAATWLIVPGAKYEAKAKLYVSARPPSILFEHKDDYTTYKRKQIAMLKTRQVLAAILRNPKVAALGIDEREEDPIEWLEENLDVGFVAGSEVMEISMEGDTPTELATIVNAAVDAYLDEVVEKERKQRLERLQKLKDTYAQYETSLADQRRTIRKLSEAIGPTGEKARGVKYEVLQDSLNMFRKEMVDVRARLRRAQVELAALEARNNALEKANIPNDKVEAFLDQDPVVVGLTQELAQTQALMAQTLKAVPKTDRAYVRLERRHRDLESAIASRKEQIRPQVVKHLQQQLRGETANSLAAKKYEIAILKEHDKMLNKLVEELDGKIAAFTKGTQDLTSLEEEIKVSEEISARVAKEVEVLELELQAPERVTVLEKAEVPKTKDETKPLKMAGMMALLVFGGVVLGLSWWEFQALRVDNPDEIVVGLGMPVVGALPPPPGRIGQRRGPYNGSWDKTIAESVDAARTLILHRARQTPMKSIMITSAVSGEGKTSVSCHLATSLARGGYRTLLIDCDLRRPAIHRLFKIPNDTGFSELIQGKASLEEVERDTSIDGLTVMAAGAWNVDLSRMLLRGDAKSIFERLNERYDFIVLDSSPVLPVADTLVLSEYVDCVLFAVLRNVSCLGAVHRAYERLTGVGAKVIGAIVNGTPGHKYGYQYVAY